MTSFFEFVENRMATDVDDRTIRSASISFLESFASQHYDDITEDSLRGWIADMITDGLKPSSRRKYLGIMNALYREWGNGTVGISPFESVKELALTDAESGIKRSESNLALVRRILNVNRDSAEYEAINIFLYLLFNPEAGMSDVIGLKFSDRMLQLSQLDEIVESMRASTRKKYVFGLDQGKRREGQIARNLIHKISTAIEAYGFDFGGEFSRDSITSIWIAAAFKAGISAVDIRSTVRNIPKDYSHLQFICNIELSRKERLNIMQRVADSIHDGGPQWFVMRVRSGNTPEDIKDAIKETSESMLKEMLFYYPSHTVVTIDKHGKKKREDKPYLPGVLFFKLRKDKVAGLFRNIGALAWCYKWTNTPDSPYCTISTNEMKAFQKHIGSFTPDIQMELVTLDTPLSVEQKVRINGNGIMDNQIGIIRSIKNNNGTRTYTLALSNREYATWTVADVEEIYIEPIND